MITIGTIDLFLLFFKGDLLGKDNVISIEAVSESENEFNRQQFFSVVVPEYLLNAVRSNSELLTRHENLAEFWPYIEDAFFEALDDEYCFEQKIPKDYSDMRDYIQKVGENNHFKQLNG